MIDAVHALLYDVIIHQRKTDAGAPTIRELAAEKASDGFGRLVVGIEGLLVAGNIELQGLVGLQEQRLDELRRRNGPLREIADLERRLERFPRDASAARIKADHVVRRREYEAFDAVTARRLEHVVATENIGLQDRFP